MRTSKFTPEQMVAICRQGESGVPVVEGVRQHGTSEQTYYLYGLPPMGKRPGTARGSVADIYPASWTSRAPMGNPRTCASTAGRPRGPL
jgi:putative transposase